MSIKKLANETLEFLVTKTRANGEDYISFKSGKPEWMQTMAYKAHGGQMPNDFRYQFIQSALVALTEYNSVDDARDSLESDIYTSELTAWLHSRNDRLCYVNEAVEELGGSNTIEGNLMLGQLLERQEVFNLVVEYLEGIDDDSEEETA